MKVARLEVQGRPRIAVLRDDEASLLDEQTSTAFGNDLTLVAGNHDAYVTLREAEQNPRTVIPLGGTRLLAPVIHPGKVVAIGRNYPAHALEEQAAVPSEPLVFAKFPSSIVGPGDAISWDPEVTQAVDFEAELAVVIGAPAHRVARHRALEHVFGYLCLNDVSARDVQFADGQWVRGKSLDSFCPIGPWIVTSEDVPDPQQLTINCRVSGELLQAASTSEMYFGVAELIHRLSRSFTLMPGDVIATGTPEGVGYFRKPQRLLRSGDIVEVTISGIGTLSNPVSPSTAE